MSKDSRDAFVKSLQSVLVGTFITVLAWSLIFFRNVPSKAEVGHLVEQRLEVVLYQLDQQGEMIRELKKQSENQTKLITELRTEIRLMEYDTKH